MNETITIRGVRFNNINMDDAARFTQEVLDGSRKQPAVIHTPNAEIVQACVENPDVMRIVNSADYIIPDGAGVILSSKILGTPLKEKVPGIRLGDKVCAQLAQRGGRLYILGGKPTVAETAGQCQCVKHPGLIISGTHDGFFKSDELPAIIDSINDSKSDVLIVCLGAPRQEKWINENRSKLNVKLIMGLGGSIDTWSGNVQPVPPLMYKLSLEWLYRLCKEPKRIRRMMKIPKFLGGCVICRISGKGRE